MKFKFFYDDQNGATAMEYALIAAAISMVITGFFLKWGDSVTNMFTDLAAAIFL